MQTARLFSRGSENDPRTCAWKGRTHVNEENHDIVKVEEGLRATERVVCSGSERTLEECDIEGMGEGGSCKLEEDIVSISCIPDSWATCEVSWKTGMDAPPHPAQMAKTVGQWRVTLANLSNSGNP